MENHKTEEQVIEQGLLEEITFLNEQLEVVWKYHPNNPDKVDAVDDYNKIAGQIEFLEEEYKSNYIK